MTRAPRLGMLLAAGGILYPAIVYFGLVRISPLVIVLFGLALIVLRLIAVRRLHRGRAETIAVILAAACILALIGASPVLAAKAYPAVICFTLAALFLLSLLHPPSAIERIARLHRPNLPPEAVAYTRKVTMVWVGFMIVNGAVSVATSLWGSLELWTLWNGLLSYVCIGILICGEFLVRRFIVPRAGR